MIIVRRTIRLEEIFPRARAQFQGHPASMNIGHSSRRIFQPLVQYLRGRAVSKAFEHIVFRAAHCLYIGHACKWFLSTRN